MKYAIVFLILLISAGSVSADFNENLGQLGFPQTVVDHEFLQVSSYSFIESGSAIVQVQHIAPYNTVVNEYYNILGTQINARYYCTNSWLTTTCTFNVSGGGESNGTSASWVNFGISDNIIDTSILYDSTTYPGIPGEIWFGVGRHDFAANGMLDPFFSLNSGMTAALISLPNLKTSPIVSMSGEASYPIDLTIQTLPIDEYSAFLDGIQGYTETQESGTVRQIQDIVVGIVGILRMFFEHPILVFAYLEIFALLFALKSRNIAQWWEKYLKIHGDILSFILNNAQAVAGALVVTVSVSILATLLGI